MKLASLSLPNKLGLISIDIDDLTTCLAEALYVGSRLSNLSWNSFDFKVNSTADLAKITTAELAYDNGMPFLDSLIYFSSSERPKDCQISLKDSADDTPLDALLDSQAIFVWFFSLWSQGRSIAMGSPNFIKEVLSLGDDCTNLPKRLTSANIEHFPKTWIKGINLDKLGEEAKNRISLGAAGHRFISACRLLDDNDFNDDDQNGKRFVKELNDWTKSKLWWSLHPIFKSGEVITATKSLNSMIEDCLHHCVKKEVLQDFVKSKILFKLPEAKPKYTDWKRISPKDFPRLADPIFGNA